MEKRRFWSYENTLVTLFFFTVGFVFFDRLAINFLMPFMQKEFELSNTQIGLLASALAVTWAISGPILGYLSEKVRSKKALVVILVVVFSLLSLLHGAAGTFGVLLILRLLMGVAEGPLLPITSSILSAESSTKRRGFNLGFVNGTAYGVFGGFLAPLIVVALAQAYDWRTAFYLTIIPGLILALLIGKLVRNPKTASNAIAASNEKASFKDVMKSRNIWLCLLIACCMWFFLLPFSIFAPLYLMDVKHLDPGTMSMIMAAFGAGNAIWGFIVPAISDRIGRKPTTLIFSILTVFAPLTLLYVDNVVLMAVLVFIFVSGIGALAMMTTVIPSENVPPKYAAATIGFILAATEIIGGVLSPIITGAAADASGLAAPLWIGSGAALVAFILALFLKESAPVKVRAEQGINTAA